MITRAAALSAVAVATTWLGPWAVIAVILAWLAVAEARAWRHQRHVVAEAERIHAELGAVRARIDAALNYRPATLEEVPDA